MNINQIKYKERKSAAIHHGQLWHNIHTLRTRRHRILFWRKVKYYETTCPTRLQAMMDDVEANRKN